MRVALLAGWIALGANAQALAQGTPPFTEARCAELATLRDGAMFQEFDRSRRGIDAAREAQKDLRALIAMTHQASSDYGTAAFAKEFLLALQIASTSLQMIYMPSGPTLLASLERSQALSTSYAATELAKRAVGSTLVAQEVTRDTPQIEQWLAFGSLMPMVVGDALSVIKTTIDLYQAHQESRIDLRSFGTRIQSLERQLGEATKRLERSQFRQHFARAFKDEVDRHCGRKKDKAHPPPATAAPLPRSQTLQDLVGAAKPPPRATTTPGNLDCGVLDDGQASMDLSINHAQQFEALLASCRERRR